MCSELQKEADGWLAFPESGHLQLQGKLRQGWNPSWSFRGGVSRKLSLELEHSVFAFSGVQEEEGRNEASPFTDGKTKETWHPYPSSLGETKYSALSTRGNQAGHLCACGVSP